MKKTILLTLAIFTLCISIRISSYGQGIGSGMLPDPFPAPPSNSNFYYQNKGQIIDELGNLHPEIKYYTEHTAPSIFLAEDKVSFVAVHYGDTSIVGVMDTMYRIDLQFICDDITGDDGSSGDNPGGGGDDEGGGEEQPEERCGDIMVYEQSQDHLNYFLPHCGAGITDVKGYARVVYHNAFPNIDVHFYSNAQAPILYFVVKPGGDPNDITLLFSGQDSIQAMGGALSMYLSEWTLDFPQAIAYEVDNANNINMLGWLPLWDHQGGGTVKVNTGPYNSADDLVIRVGAGLSTSMSNDNLEWSTYYGGDGYEMWPKVIVDEQNNVLYHSLYQQYNPGNTFPSQHQLNIMYNNRGDFYLSKFSSIGVRNWGTYYGGSYKDYALAMTAGTYLNPEEIDPLHGLWVAGTTYSAEDILITGTGNFQQDFNSTYHSSSFADGLLAFFDTDGYLKYSTLFGAGGFADDVIKDIAFDPWSNSLYIVGYTYNDAQYADICASPVNGAFPLCSGIGNKYFKNSKLNANEADGFIARFNTNDMELEWSTLFGGSNGDEILCIELLQETGGGHSIFIGGHSLSTNVDINSSGPITSHPVSAFPIVNPGGGAFVQSSTYNEPKATHGFLAKFNQDHQLEWSTFLGRVFPESHLGAIEMELNSENQLYVITSGVHYNTAAASSPNPNAFGLVPIYDNNIAYFEAPNNEYQQHLLIKFNDNLSLNFSTYLHGQVWYADGLILKYGSISIDRDNRVFVGTSMNKIQAPTYNPYGAYIQNVNASANTNHPTPVDGYIYGFNSKDKLVWQTFFGGTDNPLNPYVNDHGSTDIITSLATLDDKKLYISGMTKSSIDVPYNRCPPVIGAYCDHIYNPDMDCFISRFDISIFPDPLNIQTQPFFELGKLSAYPNPSDGVFSIEFYNNGRDEKMELRIVDISGKEMSKFDVKTKQAFNRFNIDLTGFSVGVYILDLYSDTYKQSVKLMKN